MKSSRESLERLLNRARTAAVHDSAAAEGMEAPLGFATRVVALARAVAPQAPWLQLVEQRGWRVLAAAGAVAVASIAFNLPAVVEAIEDDVFAADDPITVVLNLS